jgi:hypothetical protein
MPGPRKLTPDGHDAAMAPVLALVLARRYIITSVMTDATTHGHSHAHERAHAHDNAGAGAAPGHVHAPARGFSLIEASAGGRLLSLLLVLAALWAGVYWALH